MTQAIAAVVVPAHNEEAVIGRTLHRLLAGTAPGELHVVIVPNACADRTAEVARQAAERFAAESRRHGAAACEQDGGPGVAGRADIRLEGGPGEGRKPGERAGAGPDVPREAAAVPSGTGDDAGRRSAAGKVIVVETATPGKANALRVGDEHCGTLFPRLYLDADVELDAGSVRALVAACARPGVLACAPVPELDLDGVGPVARRMHRVHERLIAPHRALAGVGVYVLTEEGHARAFPIPADVISDDGWIHRSFRQDERAVVDEARSVVRPARTVRAHLRRRVRVRMGNRQLDALGLPLPEGRLELRDLRALVRRREVSVPEAACYLAVLVLDRALTRLRARQDGGQVAWGSDASTRITHRPAR